MGALVLTVFAASCGSSAPTREPRADATHPSAAPSSTSSAHAGSASAQAPNRAPATSALAAPSAAPLAMGASSAHPHASAGAAGSATTAPSAQAPTPAPAPAELALEWTVVQEGEGLHWLEGELVSVTAEAEGVGATSRVAITLERLGAGKAKPKVVQRATLRGANAVDVVVRPSYPQWGGLTFSTLVQTSSTEHALASATYDGKKWTRWDYARIESEDETSETQPVKEGPWCTIDVQKRLQPLDAGVSFRAEPCVFGFEPAGNGPTIVPPPKLYGEVNAVAESKDVVWVAMPGEAGRIFRWQAGAWRSARLPKGMGRYSLVLDHRPDLGLVAISDRTKFVKIRLQP